MSFGHASRTQSLVIAITSLHFITLVMTNYIFPHLGCSRINHHILMEIVERYVEDKAVIALLWGYLRRYVSDGSKFFDLTQGISLGCPLSPLIGALFLKPLDDRMAQLGCFYVRYMDDWVVLAPTRWKLRKAIKAVNKVMANLLVEKHPDKTFIGRIVRGFDFLGYWFSPSEVGLAKKTVDRMLDKVSRLYEQGADELRIQVYLERWRQWVWSGVDGVLFNRSSDPLGFGPLPYREEDDRTVLKSFALCNR